MSYSVKTIFDTVQGEGARAGARSVFLRFTGCNAWDGKPEHRAKGKGACARWCDTDFVGGKKMEAEAIEAQLSALWPKGSEQRWCVITGGEPMLQLDAALLSCLHDAHWKVAVETNGSVVVAGEVLASVDWLTVSPKKGMPLALTGGKELKVVLPGDREAPWTDAALLDMAALQFDHLFVQPQDPIDPAFVEESYLHGTVNKFVEYGQNVERCLKFVHDHPAWRVSVQAHKYLKTP